MSIDLCFFACSLCFWYPRDCHLLSLLCFFYYRFIYIIILFTFIQKLCTLEKFSKHITFFPRFLFESFSVFFFFFVPSRAAIEPFYNRSGDLWYFSDGLFHIIDFSVILNYRKKVFLLRLRPEQIQLKVERFLSCAHIGCEIFFHNRNRVISLSQKRFSLLPSWKRKKILIDLRLSHGPTCRSETWIFILLRCTFVFVFCLRFARLTAKILLTALPISELSMCI